MTLLYHINQGRKTNEYKKETDFVLDPFRNLCLLRIQSLYYSSLKDVEPMSSARRLPVVHQSGYSGRLRFGVLWLKKTLAEF